ncbi:MAG: HAMP domain-containing protein [bacterium]|nr:HAMP domain-containing protein [bacterium]
MGRASVQGRIRWLCVISTLGFAAILAVGVLQRETSRRELGELDRTRTALQAELGVRHLLEALRGDILSLLLGKSQEAQQAQQEKLQGNLRALEQQMGAFESAVAGTGLEADARAVSAEIRDAIEIAEELRTVGADDRLRTISLLGAFQRRQLELGESSSRLSLAAHTWSDEERRRVQTSLAWMERIELGGGITIAAAAVAMILALGRRTVRSLDSLRQRIQRIADGDLSAHWDGTDGDEFQALERDLAAMASEVGRSVDQMGTAAGDVGQAAESAREFAERFGRRSYEQVERAQSAFVAVQVAEHGVAAMRQSAQQLRATSEESTTAAMQLRGGSNDLAQQASILLERVEGSVATTGELATSGNQIARLAGDLSETINGVRHDVDEVAQAADNVAAECGRADELAALSLEQAERGREHILAASRGMSAVANAELGVRTQMQELTDRIDEVRELASLIEDVASETSLLALNAAIISAQAGTEGRAFAVVAEEIGSLAKRTAESTQRIHGVVDSVSRFARVTEEAVQESAEVVAREEKRARSAVEVLDEIHEGARETQGRVSEISQAAARQSALCLRGTEGMRRLSVGATEIVSSALEQAGATQSLSAACATMSDVADVMRQASRQQDQRSEDLAASAEQVGGAAAEIDRALDDQLRINRETLPSLEEMIEHARTTSATLQVEIDTLVERCEGLRESLGTLRT